LLKTVAITAAMSMVAIPGIAAPAQAAYQYVTPGAVRAVSATASSLTLDWTSVSGASAYRVQLSSTADMAQPTYSRFVGSGGVLTGLSPTKRYYFRVAVMAGGVRASRYTALAYPTGLTTGVAAPTDLAAGSSTPTTMDLSWTPPTGTWLYRVAVSTTADFASSFLLRTGRTTLSVAGLDSGQRYYFRVRAINEDGTTVSPYGTPSAAVTAAAPAADPTPVVAGSSDVRFGSYNVTSVSLDVSDGDRRPWRERRAGLLANVLGERLDVLGVQEANASSVFEDRLVSGTTQFFDIRDGLDAAGQNFQLTNEASANCVNAATTYDCVPRERGAANSDRILYNADRIALVSQGGYLYPTQDPGGTPRHMAYAVLKVKRTGDQFLFVSTHLEAHDADVRYAQWRQMMAKVAEIKGALPVIAVGDYNMQKFDVRAAEMLPAMKDAGMGDVLNQEYNVNPSRNVRAQHLVNGWMNSLNRMNRNVADWAYEDQQEKTGNSIDWVFATNALTVKEYKVVVDFDPVTMLVRGVIPSDHNMLRATITIP
jgi:endonuclease/exonuclease/phosphatase family metal-dependent hydrolase